MESLVIKNFKCFKEVEISINQLTIFAGANGFGKSTSIQALLLIRRTIEQRFSQLSKIDNKFSIQSDSNKSVELNGPYCLSLGNGNLVIPRNSTSQCIELGIKSKNESFNFFLDIDLDNILCLRPCELDMDAYFGLELTSIFKNEFYYLNAERIGPRVKQDISFFNFPHTGFQGEYVAQLLGDTEFNYQFDIDTKRRHPNSKSKRLEQQVNAWLDEIMPGVSVKSTYDLNTLSAQIKLDNPYTMGESVLAPNIGFGISYVLPIIVTGLIAKQNSFMIVENPEAHLHPSAQSKIGSFLAMVANSGVKVIIETHSDHLINGVQLSAAKKEIDNDRITINFFSSHKETNEPKVEAISILPKGELTSWPRGFFDQAQVDFAELFKIRKG